MSIQVAPERMVERPRQALADAAQWGLAALMIGGTLVVASCALLVFNILFWRTGPAGIPMGLAFMGGVVGTLGILCLGGFGIAAGIRAWSRAASDGTCLALPLAGLLASAAGVVAWLIVAIDLIMILHAFDSGMRPPSSLTP